MALSKIDTAGLAADAVDHGTGHHHWHWTLLRDQPLPELHDHGPEGGLIRRRRQAHDRKHQK